MKWNEKTLNLHSYSCIQSLLKASKMKKCSKKFTGVCRSINIIVTVWKSNSFSKAFPELFNCRNFEGSKKNCKNCLFFAIRKNCLKNCLNPKMEELSLLHGQRIYSCSTCRTHLAKHDDVVSKCFQGRHGRAFLFSNMCFVEDLYFSLLSTVWMCHRVPVREEIFWLVIMLLRTFLAQSATLFWVGNTYFFFHQ